MFLVPWMSFFFLLDEVKLPAALWCFSAIYVLLLLVVILLVVVGEFKFLALPLII